MDKQVLITTRLTNNQIISLTQLLSKISKEDMENWCEWIEDWIKVENLRIDLSYHLKNNILTIDEDVFWSLFNFLVRETNHALMENKGEAVFNEYRDLAEVIYKSYSTICPDTYPMEIFIPDHYIPLEEREVVSVDLRKIQKI